MVVVIKPNELDNYHQEDSFYGLTRRLPGLSLVVPFNDSVVTLFGLYRECSFDLPRCYGRLVKSMWPVVREEQNKPRWGRKCPIARKFKKSCAIEIGNSINVVSLLSGEGEMNYLVRNDDVYSRRIQSLANICYELYSTRTDVEMVVVVKMNKLANHELVFNHFLTGFPSSCLVVPLKDSKRRNFIYIKRNILVCGSPDNWWDQRADAFPFTDKKLQEIGANKYEYPRWKAPSTTTLEGLLGCSPDDVVYKINSAGVREQEITVSELREKVVGLYLLNGWENFTPRLHEVYEQCRTQNLAFEIVLVYIPFDDCLDPEAYKANVDSMLQKQNISTNWWRLPFNNSVSRRLHELTTYGCHYGSCSQQLIIVGPHDEYVEPYGAEVMYRIMLFEEMTRLLCLNSKAGYIILYLDHLGEDLSLYDELLNWYDEIKAKHPSFEVVFVRLESSSISNTEMEDESVLSAIMPWLICPFDPDHSASVAKKIFTKEQTYNTLIQFGEDGRICTTQAQHPLRKQGPGDFPFGDNTQGSH
uniref:Uncharacterized protein n=1 Tax=Chenopodium quinoa TaxID=63459 RepID=A0A803M9C5_CHEQI